MYRPHVCACLAVAVVGLALASAQTPEAKPAMPPFASPVGAGVLLSKMEWLIEIPEPESLEDFHAKIAERMPKVLATLSEMERKYPKSEQIHEARMIGVLAASRLARVNEDPAMAARAKGLAKKIIDAKGAPGSMRVFADAHLTMMEINPVSATASRPDPGSEKMVKAFVARHGESEYAVQALKLGIQMSIGIRDRKLFESLRDDLIEKFPDDPDSKKIRRSLGKGPDIGKPFRATLAKLDGRRIELPQDMLGKVVVIDFWATWCGLCIREIPRMKTLYARYKDKGVEFVGISLDREDDKGKLTAFVVSQRMGWVHTFSGKGWEDPTAKEYDVRSIPSIWVVGKDGKVFSDNARATLAEVIEKALAVEVACPSCPTTRPHVYVD